jgi:hypothetical protein
LSDKLTRRQLAGTVAGSAAVSLAALKVIAQTPPSARDFDQEARDAHKENSTVLAAFRIPISLEPAFQFKA